MFMALPFQVVSQSSFGLGTNRLKLEVSELFGAPLSQRASHSLPSFPSVALASTARRLSLPRKLREFGH